MQRLRTTRLFSGLYLNLTASVIALAILALSAHTLWTDRQATWRDAQQSSRNLLTAVARDLGSDIELLDLLLRGAIDSLRYVGFEHLPPDIQHRMLFDRAVAAGDLNAMLVLNEAGDIIADAGSIIASRSLNFADQDYFTVHKQSTLVGLYVSRPYRDAIRNGDLSIAISRRFSHQDGSFAGIVMAVLSLSSLQEQFRSLDLGQQGTISLLRSDGVLVMRQPDDKNQINRDLSGSPNTQRFLQEHSGSFEGTSALDGVRRLYTFGRVASLPLILSISLSVDERFAAWNRKALILGLVTVSLCSAVMGLTFLFQRELRRRTKAETKLRRLARTDDLTGLPNRRAFRETFAREWRQAIRSGSSLSLLFIDADFFKAYNDQYGHRAGDELLRRMATTLQANIRRPRDVAARYGGEEFTALLPETDQAGARVVAENIRRAIMQMRVEHTRNSHGVATVSIGVASARPFRGGVGEALLEAADAALYQAKAAGRNCVYLSDVEPVLGHKVALSSAST